MMAPGLGNMVSFCGIHHEFGTGAGLRTEQSSIRRVRNGAEPGICFGVKTYRRPGAHQAKFRCAPRERRCLVFPRPLTTDVFPISV